VFGATAAIQRCSLHKRRNVADYLPGKEQAWVDAKLVKAFGHPDPGTGLANAKTPAAQLERTILERPRRCATGRWCLRWTAAGMLNAQRSFRHVKGHKQMPRLIDALRRVSENRCGFCA
jgi:hypothetical protein